MRRLLKRMLTPFFTWLAEKYSAAPQQNAVFESLSNLYKQIALKKTSSGLVIPVDPMKDSFIIFSDQHKGTKNFEDDFQRNEVNYNAALQHYHQEGYHYINLGDAEELWKNAPDKIIAAYPEAIKAEAGFHAINRYFRTYGNHDLLWKNKLDVLLFLKSSFPLPLPIYEGIVLRLDMKSHPPTDIFCTHGHQGDFMSDNNAFSTWVVAHIWAPIQGFLRLNINTPSNDFLLRNKHNRMMYDWSSQQNNLLLVTGHTHKPVFASGKYSPAELTGIAGREDKGSQLPTYFNTGCCCYNDGDITGIEINNGYIRLVKWYQDLEIPKRKVLEEKLLTELLTDLNAARQI